MGSDSACNVQLSTTCKNLEYQCQISKLLFFFQIHAVATLTHVVMPSLFPSCAKFYELGNFFVDGEYRHNLLEVSPDGVIR